MPQVGINFADVFTCLGLYQAAPKNNVVLGLEVGYLFVALSSTSCCAMRRLLSLQSVLKNITQLRQFAGVVTAIPDTTPDSLSQQQANTAADPCLVMPAPQLQVGDHVLGACRFGSYTTCLNVPAQQVTLTHSSPKPAEYHSH